VTSLEPTYRVSPAFTEISRQVTASGAFLASVSTRSHRARLPKPHSRYIERMLPHLLRYDVLGVLVDDVREDDVLAFVRARLRSRIPGQIVTVNAEYVILATGNPEFARVLRNAALATPDGAGVVWAMRRQGCRISRRVGGSDLIWSIALVASQENAGVYLLGGADGVAAEVAEALRQAIPGVRVVGIHAGSPSLEEEAAIVDSIRQSGAGVLFVAYGAPPQDIWVERNVRATGVAIAMGVGGTFDYVSGRAKRAPRWMRDTGLDWAWRLIMQPWRWRRMLALPVFVWRVLRSRPSAPIQRGLAP
jgi:N-acetylglucosaminyldiphosphoundecaprenol N-acetyl-beta-D-mannosaminyltransferase